MFVTIIVMTTITSIVLLVLSVINFFKKLVKVMDETKLTTHNSQITILNSGFVIKDGVKSPQVYIDTL